MHGNQWNDFDLDYQVADPMESNHYEQGRSPFAVLIAFGFLFVTIVRMHNNFKFIKYILHMVMAYLILSKIQLDGEKNLIFLKQE